MCFTHFSFRLLGIFTTPRIIPPEKPQRTQHFSSFSFPLFFLSLEFHQLYTSPIFIHPSLLSLLFPHYFGTLFVFLIAVLSFISLIYIFSKTRPLFLHPNVYYDITSKYMKKKSLSPFVFPF